MSAGNENRTGLASSEEQSFTRHPGDLLRLVLGAVILAGGVALTERGRVGEVESALFRLINALPAAMALPLRVVMQAGSLGAVVVTTGGALLARRRRLARDLAAGGALAWVLAKVVKAIVERARPRVLLDDVTIRGARAAGLGFPSGHVAVASALATAAAPYLSTRMRRATWGIVWLVALARVYVGVHLPMDVLGGAALGWAIGAAVHLIWGAPGGRPSPEAVGRALESAGFSAVDVWPARVDARGSAPFFAVLADGTELFIKTVGRQQRNADWLFKAWRFLVFREVGDEAPFATPKQQIEHEAYLSLLAERAGVRTPSVVSTTQLDDGTTLLIQQRVAGRGLDALEPDEVGDSLLYQIWEQVRSLRKARIGHRDLRLANILVDGEGQPWVIDFGFAVAAANHRQFAQDVAELLASLSCLVGAERALSAAVEVLGREPVRPALPFLQPLALSSATRGNLRRQRGLLEELRDRVAGLTGPSPPPSEPLTRLQLRHLVWLVGGAIAVHSLLPQVGELGYTLTALNSVKWAWLIAGLLWSISAYLMAAITQMGSIDHPLALGRTVMAQYAASFANRLGPPGVGGTVVRIRYLERAGVERSAAVNAAALNLAAGFIVHVLGLTAALALLGETGVGPVGRLPRGWPALIAVVTTMGLLGLILWSPLRRQRVVSPVIEAGQNLIDVLRRPRRAMRLFGGAAGVTAASVLTLAASLRAFGVSAPLIEVVAVHLGGTAVGALSPTPGGLGAIEAALVAGLTVVGVETGPAVAGVLAFRLLTFWLPIAPGFLAFRDLQRKQIL